MSSWQWLGMAGWLLVVSAPVVPAAGPRSGRNLIRNGDFEAGQHTPDGWQTVDGLSSFWVEDSDRGHGKVLKFDTDVLQSQAYEWWAKIVRGALPKDAPAKASTAGHQYETLAGLDGVWFYSDAVAVEPGKAYWLSLDVKGPEMMVWLLGYAEKPAVTFGADAAAFQGYLGDRAGTRSTGRGHAAFIHQYAWKGQLKAGGGNEWRSYSRREKPFRPTQNTPEVRWVRVLLMPYWPPAVSYVDNVRLEELDDGGATQ